jgi:hypothetical protein
MMVIVHHYLAFSYNLYSLSFQHTKVFVKILNILSTAHFLVKVGASHQHLKKYIHPSVPSNA